jgi:hypothetical protein
MFFYSDLDEDGNPNGTQQNCGLLRAPMKFGEVSWRIAEIGAKAAGQQLPVEHEDIITHGRRARLRPGDHPTGDGCAVNGAD